MQQNLSVFLDLTRLFAALLVFVVHANYERLTGGLPVLWRVSGLGNDAVMVFFVLSGFVIAYVTDTREKSLAVYFSSRLARLWSVGIAAILLTMALDGVGRWLTPSAYPPCCYADSFPVVRALANLFFVSEVWFVSLRLFSNGPFWSISYEFWYYVIFGFATYLTGRLRIAAVAAASLVAGPKILLLFPVWLLGVWAFRSRVGDGWSLRMSAMVFAGTIMAYIALRGSGAIDRLDDEVSAVLGRAMVVEQLKWSRYFVSSYLIGLLFAVNFVAARSIARHQPERPIPWSPQIAYLASFTFSLYLLHYPLLQFFAAVAEHAGWQSGKRLVVLVGTLAVVWALGGWLERQKHPLRRLLLTAWRSMRQRLAFRRVP